jgi:hypothetical protein
MIVKCIKNKLEKSNLLIINDNMSDYLTIGSELIVYGITIEPQVVYYIIYDGEHLLHVPSELFEVIDDKVSVAWIVNNLEERGLTFWPKLFYQPYFFDDFSEREQSVRNQFKIMQRDFE